MKKNKFGFITARANLKYTRDIMLCCSNDGTKTWYYFSRNRFGSINNATKARENFMRTFCLSKTNGSKYGSYSFVDDRLSSSKLHNE